MYRITSERDGVVTVVSAEGELDAFAAPELDEAFARTGAPSRVVADLGGVTFMDSTALGLIVRHVRECREGGGDARVVLPATRARRIFEITTLDRTLPVSADRGEAVASLRVER